MNYTEKMNDLMFQQYGIFDNEDQKETVYILNDENLFRSFGEGLVALLQKKYPEINEENVLTLIKKLCKLNGVQEKEIGSINTLKSWFRNGPRPKKGNDSRESLFALSFALSFSPEETVELFHKVYLDRAFDFRNENEIVYYFCLSNNITWQNAKRIISNIQYDVDSGDATLYTLAIKSEIDTFKEEIELLKYIKTHQHNLAKKNVTAKNYLSKLVEDAKKYAMKEAELPQYEDIFDGSWRKENTISINFMYAMITETTPSAEKGTVTVFKNMRLPKEIKNRFPEVASFSEKEPTYESIRKMIILLFSYKFWYEVQWNNKSFDIDDYVEQLNALLNDCGFSLLYAGNPFDWLFLYCSLHECPLDVFRSILAESLNTEDVNNEES